LRVIRAFEAAPPRFLGVFLGRRPEDLHEFYFLSQLLGSSATSCREACKSKCGDCASCVLRTATPATWLLESNSVDTKKSELDSLECSLTSAQYRSPAEREDLVVPLSVQKSKATGSQYTPKQHMPEEQKVLDPKHESQVAHLPTS
jgi:hypothetical protein